MADLLRTGSAWLAAKLKQHAGESVTYRRGGQSVAVTATVGPQPLRVSDEYGAPRVEWANEDFLIDAADLVLGGAAAEPAHGDLIERTEGGVTFTYEVTPPPGEAAWRWADAYRVKYRIHAKQISQG